MKILRADKEQIHIIVDTIISFSDRYNIFLLDADIGIGKSFLVNSYCERFGIVSNSPTFSFIHEYVLDSNNMHIYHYDLYLKNDTDSKMRLLESLQRCGMHFIEWGDATLMHALNSQGFACMLIKITDSVSMRTYEFIESSDLQNK